MNDVPGSQEGVTMEKIHQLTPKFEQRREANPFEKMSDGIAGILRSEILKMGLKPGFRFNVSELARSFGISRSPIIDALNVLQAEGLVQSAEQRKSFQVSQMDLTNLRALCSVRGSIEGGAAFYAAQRITNGELDRMRELIEDYSRTVFSEDFYEHADIDDTFHLLLVSSSHNPYYVQAYGMIRNELLRYRYYLNLATNQKNMQTSLQFAQYSHWGMYNALRLRMSDMAKKEAENDAANMVNTYVRLMDVYEFFE